MKWLLSVIVLFSFASGAQDDVDHVAIARLMVKEGLFQRAKNSLDKINLETDDVILKDYHTAWGMVHSGMKNHEKARTSYLSALASGQKNKEIFLYLAESEHELGDSSKALMTLEKVDKATREKAGYFILKSTILWKLNQRDQAYSALELGRDAGVSPVLLGKMQFRFLMELELFHSAAEKAQSLQSQGALPRDVAAMGGALRLARQYPLAIHLFEAARLKWPRENMILLELAQNYLALDMDFSAALILEESTRYSPDLANEASELLRQLGKLQRADYLHHFIADPEKQVKQKMALYIELDQYHKVSGLAPQLNQFGLLQDEDIRYALAFSQFQTGEFSKAEAHLNKITRNDLFSKAVEIRRSIESCRKNKWMCHESI